MDTQKISEFTLRADEMLHKMHTANELLKRSGKFTSPDFKLTLTDIKTLCELGETAVLAMELFPDQLSQHKGTVDSILHSLKMIEDVDLEKMLQLMSLFNSME